MLSKPDKGNLIRIFAKGGMVAPQELMTILETARSLGNTFVLFGSRQDILFPVLAGNAERVGERLASHTIDFRQGGRELFQNIVSSAVTIGITDKTSWLDLNRYHSILDAFRTFPHLKINITDPKQAMVPLFTGDLNFVASNRPEYWYLYLRNPYTGDTVEKWPTLVHSSDIARLAGFLEQRWSRDPQARLADLVVGLAEHIKLNTVVTRETLQLPLPTFPYYEGMESLGDGRLWLGLYWRNNRFDISFLLRACRLCVEKGIPYFYITPWKSFIIKDIEESDRPEWEKLMGGMGINMRHSSLELNWHIPVLDEEALDLKRFLVNELDQQDICTFGLTFSIITGVDIRWFTSIVIKKDSFQRNSQQPLFDIYHAERFNPNGVRYILYAKGITKQVIPALLIELSKWYYTQS
jgi:hypothetical protein